MTMNDQAQCQRIWARIAGLMYWAVLVVDIAGMRFHSSLQGSLLLLSGSILTVPLALGLYYAVRPVHTALAACALWLRLLEVALGLVSVIVGFPGVQPKLSTSTLGTQLEALAAWGDATNFAAFVFTLGSAIFFYLFLRSGYIPRLLAGWGLFASVVAAVACCAHLCRPDFPSMTLYAWVPILIAETSTGLWLLIKSVQVRRQLPA